MTHTAKHMTHTAQMGGTGWWGMLGAASRHVPL